MVLFHVVDDMGMIVCAIDCPVYANVGDLLRHAFGEKPSVRDATLFIRNDARGTVYALHETSTPSQTSLLEAQLTSLNAEEETLVLSRTRQRPVPRADVEAQIVGLFEGQPTAPASRAAPPPVPSPQRQQHQQQQPSVQPVSVAPAPAAVDSAAIDPALLDPAQAEMQRRLYEYIQQQQIDENLANALEYTPEAFARVIMLYVPCTINQVPIKAFVDSGAQMSIMNRATAERCGLMRLVDKRMRGVAVGVGRQEILGRIHMAPVNLSGMHIPFSFSVIAEQDIDLIIGLDQLKRHQMVIDLRQNCLVIDTVQVPFLPEGEIPKREGIDVEAEGGEEGGEVAATTGAEEDAPAHHPQPASPASPAAALPGTSASAAAPVNVTGSTATATATPPPSEADQRVLAAVNRGLQVERFMDFTGLLDREQARALLEAAEWDPDVAGAMYFDA